MHDGKPDDERGATGDHDDPFLTRPAIVVLVTAIVAGVLAAFADAAPTGLGAWDTVLKMAMAALFVAAVAASPTWVAILVATIATVFVGDSVWLGPVALGLILAIGGGALATRRPWLSVLSAGLAVQGLLRIPAVGFFGLPSLIVAATVGFVFVVAYRGASGTTTRRVRRGVLGSAGLGLAVCAVGGFALLSAKSDVDRGIAAARQGLSAARGGDPTGVVDELAVAADALGSAHERASSGWTQPLRLVPIVAQHRDAVVVATAQGSAVAAQAARTVVDADISSVSMSGGSVDLEALSSMENDLAETAASLETAIEELDAALSPWLVSPVASRLAELTDELREVLPDARLAADAARVVPGLLGDDSPQRYFVAFGTPAESREFGGFVSSWALVEFDDGDVRQIEAGRIADLYSLARSKEPLTTPDYPPWFIERARPGEWPQNLTSSPDISVVAAASRALFDGVGGGSIDGFIYVDVYAISAILELAGPLSIDGVDGQINAGNVVDFLFDKQYRLENRDEVKSEAGEIFSLAFSKLRDGQLPGPERIGRILGPAARQGRLQVAMFDDEQNTFLQSIKVQRPFGWPADTADGFAVVQTSGRRNKLDLYLHREVVYDVVVDDEGELSASVMIELTLEVPADAPEYTLGGLDPGLNVTYLSLYTPHIVTGLQVDGETAELAYISESGYGRNEVAVELRPGQTRSVRFDLTGRIDADRQYGVSVWHQPLVNRDTVQINAILRGEPAQAADFELVENTTVHFGADGVLVAVVE